MAYRGPSIGQMFGFLWRWDVASGLWYYVSGAITIVVGAAFYYGLLLMYENPDSAPSRLAVAGAKGAGNAAMEFIDKHTKILADKALPSECASYRADAYSYVRRADENGDATTRRIVKECEEKKMGVGIPGEYQERRIWTRTNAELPDFHRLDKPAREKLVREAAARLGLTSRDMPGVPSTRGNYTQAYFEAEALWNIRRKERHDELVTKWESDYERQKN